MTLSCRAQAFSVDNLLRISSRKTTLLETIESALVSYDGETCSNNSQTSTFTASTTSPERGRDFEDDDDDDVADNEVRENPAIPKHLYLHEHFLGFNHPNKTSYTHDSKSALEDKGETKATPEDKKSTLPSEHARATPRVKETNGCRVPLFSCRSNVNEGEVIRQRSVTSPGAKYLPTSATSSLRTSSCFSHGDLNFCHHPGILSVGDSQRFPVIVELCHSELWTSFHRLGTEMIITKSGRRMFPALKMKVTGLNPDKMYTITLEFLQPDKRKYRYIYHSSRWMVSGSGDSMDTPSSHRAPEGPTSGQAICSQIVSFERLKLTNTESSKPGQVSLVSMQKFQPQVVIEEVDNRESRTAGDDGSREKYVILFPQTSFMAVTAYQNQQITTLKIASNPFAKGFRESGKARLPYESLITPLQNPVSCINRLDYIHALLTPSPWSSNMFHQERLTLGSAKRCYVGHCAVEPGKPLKMAKLDDKNYSAIVNPKQAMYLSPTSFFPIIPASYVTPQQTNNPFPLPQLPGQHLQRHPHHRQQIESSTVAHILNPLSQGSFYQTILPNSPAQQPVSAAFEAHPHLTSPVVCVRTLPTANSLSFHALPHLPIPSPHLPLTSTNLAPTPILHENAVAPGSEMRHLQYQSETAYGHSAQTQRRVLEQDPVPAMPNTKFPFHDRNTSYVPSLHEESNHMKDSSPSKYTCANQEPYCQGVEDRRLSAEHVLSLAIPNGSVPLHNSSLPACLTTDVKSSESSPGTSVSQPSLKSHD